VYILPALVGILKKELKQHGRCNSKKKKKKETLPLVGYYINSSEYSASDIL
jgi:hypothetical protein